MTQRRLSSQDSGFTLIEVMAALMIFAIMTLGLVPLLASSIKGAALAQSNTVGKNLTVEAMERVRGLPYYVGFGAQPKRVDVLDLYYPSFIAGGTFTTTCDASTTSTPACPKAVPAGFVVEFKATFVEQTGTAGAQTYAPEPALTTYRWDSETADLPPSQTLELIVTAKWTKAGKPRQFELKTLISDREFGDVKIRGVAKIEFGVEVQTTYSDSLGALSQLTATGGQAEGEAESRTTATARETVRSGDLRLVEVPADASQIGEDLATAEGAKSLFRAPPDQTPSDEFAGPVSITHPSLGSLVAGLDDTRTDNLVAGASGEIPVAAGDFSYLGGLGTEDMWVRPQVSTATAALLHLDTSQPMFSLRTSGGNTLSGTTDVVTTLIAAADRKVEAVSDVDLYDLRLLPTTFSSAVVVIDSFSATTSCKSTASAATATKAASWSATIRYYRDTNNNGILDGGYVSPALLITGNSASDALAGLAASNPLVYDGATPASDVYLFQAPDKEGYLLDAGSLFDVSTTGVVSDAGGNTTSAAIDGAVSIKTAPMDAAVAGSGLNLEIGKLSCEAVDNR